MPRRWARQNLPPWPTPSAKGKGLLDDRRAGQLSAADIILGTPLGNALPIEIDPLEGAEFHIGRGRGPLLPARPAAAGADRAAPDHAARARGRKHAAWQELPPLNWANKFAGLKPDVHGRCSVLLATPAGQPLLVSGEYRQRPRAGLCRRIDLPLAACTASNSEHKRFWRQVVLWLVRRDDLNRDDVWIKLDQRRFNPGSSVHITAGARTAAGDPIADAQFETTLVRPDGRREPLTLCRSTRTTSPAR